MQITETRLPGALVVEPHGRLDSNTSKELDRALRAAVQRGDKDIVLDFTHLDYIGSMGLSAILAATKRARAEKGSVSIRNMNERVKLVFEMSGFLRLFDVQGA